MQNSQARLVFATFGVEGARWLRAAATLPSCRSRARRTRRRSFRRRCTVQARWPSCTPSGLSRSAWLRSETHGDFALGRARDGPVSTCLAPGWRAATRGYPRCSILPSGSLPQLPRTTPQQSARGRPASCMGCGLLRPARAAASVVAPGRPRQHDPRPGRSPAQALLQRQAGCDVIATAASSGHRRAGLSPRQSDPGWRDGSV